MTKHEYTEPCEDLFNEKQIRSKYSKRFNRLAAKKGPIEAGVILFTHVFLATLMAYASYNLWSVDPILGGFFYLLTVIFIGFRYRALANILHETTHHCFVKNKKHNDILSNCICILLFYSFRGYRDHHWSHHKFTGDYAKDLEFSPIEDFNLHQPINKNMFFAHLTRILKLGHLSHYIGGIAFDKREAKPWLLLRLVYILTLLGLCLFTDATFIVIGYVIVPIFLVIPTITYVMDIMDHSGLLNKNNRSLRARNYTTKNKIINFLFFPRSDTYHLVHHLFPSLPTDVLPQCHKILLEEEPEYRNIPHTLEELVNEFKK